MPGPDRGRGFYVVTCAGGIRARGIRGTPSARTHLHGRPPGRILDSDEQEDIGKLAKLAVDVLDDSVNARVDDRRTGRRQGA